MSRSRKYEAPAATEVVLERIDLSSVQGGFVSGGITLPEETKAVKVGYLRNQVVTVGQTMRVPAKVIYRDEIPAVVNYRVVKTEQEGEVQVTAPTRVKILIGRS